MDLLKKFHQIIIKEESREKAAFTTHCGLFRYKALPFGLTNAPASFQRFIRLTLRKYENKACLLLITSTNFERHLHHPQ